MNVLLTGSSGFIGKAIKHKLTQADIKVIPYDIAEGYDILNAEQLRDTIEKENVDIVFHAAAEANLYSMEEASGAQKGIDINVKGTMNVVSVCSTKRVKLIYASTMCVYGDTDCSKLEYECVPQPQELYASTKLIGEHLIKGYNNNFGLEYVILRFATVYGPNQRDALGTSIFLKQALQNIPLTVHGTGNQTRTLTYIDDIAEGCLLACTHFEEAKNRTYNLTSTEEISALQMAKDIIGLCNSQSTIEFVPQRKNQTFREKTSNARARLYLKWTPAHTWAEGLKKTYEWYASKSSEG
jgi:UDP-glucose 4-epimerase